jgi:hypothetical protein
LDHLAALIEDGHVSRGSALLQLLTVKPCGLGLHLLWRCAFWPLNLKDCLTVWCHYLIDDVCHVLPLDRTSADNLKRACTAASRHHAGRTKLAGQRSRCAFNGATTSNGASRGFNWALWLLNAARLVEHVVKVQAVAFADA